MGDVVVLTGMLLVIGLLWYVWRHRTGIIARGIGAAGTRYNELYGQGTPPRFQPPVDDGLEPDAGDPRS